jgi:hypothetical protein
LDPLNYLRGKYDLEDSAFKTLPKLGSTITSCLPKVLDVNNSSYVDSFFTFLSGELLHKHKFIHGVHFYGSYLGIKRILGCNPWGKTGFDPVPKKCSHNH